MAVLEEATNPGAEGEATHNASQEVAETTNADNGADGNELETGEEGAAGDDGQQQAADDTDEVEYEGAKYRVPKVLKDAILRNEDYTRKTQEVAATRKELEQQAQALTQQAEVQKATLGERVQLAGVESELAAYAKVDWHKLHAEDPAGFAFHSDRKAELREQARLLGGSIAQKEQQALETQRGDRAKRAQESEAVIARDIKGWGKEKAEQLVSLAESVGGMPRQAMVDAMIMFPGAAKILELASIGQQFLAKQSAAPTKTKPPVEAKPVTMVNTGGRASPKPLAELPMKDFVEARNKQERERARRT